MTGHFKVLDGQRAGALVVARRFPFRVGRRPEAELRMEESGVWEEHLEVQCDRVKGFTVRVIAPALARLNGAPLDRAVLRSGDLLELGSIRLQFWLPPAEPAASWARETLAWLGLTGIAALQVWLAYWISK